MTPRKHSATWKFSEYDGWTPSSAGAMDPMKNDVALSCSRLENLAKCPFAFFIRHVLGIEPLEGLEKDVGRWLDPLQRGELLHEVFYRFMEELKIQRQLPEFKKHVNSSKPLRLRKSIAGRTRCRPPVKWHLPGNLRTYNLLWTYF